jgi:hypothetical protein
MVYCSQDSGIEIISIGEIMQALFLTTFIVELLFAVGFIAAPGFMFSNFGVSLDPFGTALTRLFGSALLAFCTLVWYARLSESVNTKKAALRSMFVYWLVSTILMVITQLNGLVNSMGWVTIGLHLIFLIWTGAFAFKE